MNKKNSNEKFKNFDILLTCPNKNSILSPIENKHENLMNSNSSNKIQTFFGSTKPTQNSSYININNSSENYTTSNTIENLNSKIDIFNKTKGFLKYQEREEEFPVIHTKSQFFNSNKFARNSTNDFNKKLETNELTKTMLNTNSHFYDSTFFVTSKSKFSNSKPWETSFSPKNITSSVDKTKGNFEINNTKEINESVYGFSNVNFNITNKFDKSKLYSQENFFRNSFLKNKSPFADHNKKKKLEVSYKLTGNVKLNSLVTPKKYYKDYFLRYVTKSVNKDKENLSNNQKETFKRKYIEDEDYKRKLNFYSQSLDYNFIKKNINKQNFNNREFKILREEDELENSMNKIILEEVKNGIKKKFPKEIQRKEIFRKPVENKDTTKGVEFSKQIDRNQNFSYLNEFLKINSNSDALKSKDTDNNYSMDVIKYLYKINKDMINGYENDSVYKNIVMPKGNFDFPKDEEVIDIFQKLCKRVQNEDQQ